mmetsp:Transcript_46912/g.101930  ORF Transcript_46912/g.101930 Transcript_46912/m.101930 type:complete len:953 (-) Transcript_46912:123-2981(-)
MRQLLSDEAPPPTSVLLAYHLKEAGLQGFEGLLAQMGLQSLRFLGEADDSVFSAACAAAVAQDWGPGHLSRLRGLRLRAQESCELTGPLSVLPSAVERTIATETAPLLSAAVAGPLAGRSGDAAGVVVALPFRGAAAAGAACEVSPTALERKGEGDSAAGCSRQLEVVMPAPASVAAPAAMSRSASASATEQASAQARAEAPVPAPAAGEPAPADGESHRSLPPPETADVIVNRAAERALAALRSCDLEGLSQELDGLQNALDAEPWSRAVARLRSVECEGPEAERLVASALSETEKLLLWQLCRQVQLGHKLQQKEAASDAVQRIFEVNYDEKQLLLWIQDFSCEMLMLKLPKALEHCGCSLATPHMKQAEKVINGCREVEEIAKAVDAAEQASQDRLCGCPEKVPCPIKDVLAALRDMLVCGCCYEVGVSDQAKFQLSLVSAFQRQLPPEQSSKLSQAFHQCIGFLPGAFRSKAQSRKPRLRKAIHGPGQGPGHGSNDGSGEGSGHPVYESQDPTLAPNAEWSIDDFSGEDLSWEPSWSVQVNALFKAIKEAKDAEVAASCAEALGKLLASPQLQVARGRWHTWPAELICQTSASIAPLFLAAMERFREERLRGACIAALLGFCRTWGIVLGLLTEAEGQFGVVAFQPALQRRIRENVEAALNDESCGALMLAEGQQLLARTQDFRTALGLATGIWGKHEALDEIFTGLYRHLDSFHNLRVSNSRAEAEDSEWGKLLTKVAWQRAKQEDQGAVYEALQWVEKEYANEHKQKLRFLLVGLLYPFGPYLLWTLAQSQDQVLLQSSFQAIASLSYLQLITDQWETLSFLLSRETYQHRCRPTRQGYFSSKKAALAALMRGSASQTSAFAREFFEETVWECYSIPWRDDENGHDDQHGVAVHVALWALEEIFAGADSLGSWESKICGLAEWALSAEVPIGAKESARKLLNVTLQ